MEKREVLGVQVFIGVFPRKKGGKIEERIGAGHWFLRLKSYTDFAMVPSVNAMGFMITG